MRQKVNEAEGGQEMPSREKARSECEVMRLGKAVARDLGLRAICDEKVRRRGGDAGRDPHDQSPKSQIRAR